MTREDVYAHLHVAAHALLFILAVAVLVADCEGVFDCDDGVYAHCHEAR